MWTLKELGVRHAQSAMCKGMAAGSGVVGHLETFCVDGAGCQCGRGAGRRAEAGVLQVPLLQERLRAVSGGARGGSAGTRFGTVICTFPVLLLSLLLLHEQLRAVLGGVRGGNLLFSVCILLLQAWKPAGKLESPYHVALSCQFLNRDL